MRAAADLSKAVAVPANLIEARDVVRSFGETPALRGANLSVASGEIVAIMGPSGSGKSTLLHCLAGIYRPDSGEIWFDGKRIDAWDEDGPSCAAAPLASCSNLASSYPS
jgi:putative ABC transport system ATP-binding protein